MVTRRQVVLALGAGALGPLAVLGQSSIHAFRIGVLIDTRTGDSHLLKTLSERLAANGFVENKDVIVEVSSAELDMGQIPVLARRMVSTNPNVIYTTHEVWVEAIRRETSTIPIVFSFVTEPVELGFVHSLSRSGTNIVGVTDRGREINIKRMELLREAFPKLRRLLVITAFEQLDKAGVNAIHEAAGQLKFKIIESDISNRTVRAALDAARHRRPDGVLPIGGLDVRPGEQGVKQLNEFAARSRIPIVYSNSRVVDGGGLMSLDIDGQDNIWRSAELVVRILKGARPAEMPVQQAAKFELVVNLKTAKALGLKIPQSILLRANRVVE